MKSKKLFLLAVFVAVIILSILYSSKEGFADDVALAGPQIFGIVMGVLVAIGLGFMVLDVNEFKWVKKSVKNNFLNDPQSVNWR